MCITVILGLTRLSFFYLDTLAIEVGLYQVWANTTKYEALIVACSDRNIRLLKKKPSPRAELTFFWHLSNSRLISVGRVAFKDSAELVYETCSRSPKDDLSELRSGRTMHGPATTNVGEAAQRSHCGRQFRMGIVILKVSHNNKMPNLRRVFAILGSQSPSTKFTLFLKYWHALWSRLLGR